MILIIVTADVKPEHVPSFEQTIEEVCQRAVSLDGCESYHWYRDSHISDRYMVYGEFEHMEAFLSYKNSPVVQTIVTEVIPLTSSKPAFKHFDGAVFEEG